MGAFQWLQAEERGSRTAMQKTWFRNVHRRKHRGFFRDNSGPLNNQQAIKMFLSFRNLTKVISSSKDVGYDSTQVGFHKHF